MSDEMEEIWDLYVDDGKQALDAMEEALDALLDGDGEPETHVAALFRAVHTFKGNSRVLGLSVVESRAHLAEDLIGLVRDDGVALTSEILDTLLLASDTLRSMLEQTAATRADVDPGPSEHLYETLNALIQRLRVGDEADAEPEAAVPFKTTREGSEPAQPIVNEEVAPEPDGSSDEAEAETPEPTTDGQDVAAQDVADGAEPSAPDVAEEVHDDTVSEAQGASTDASERDAPMVASTGAVQNAGSLAQDEGYRKIFNEMASETMGLLDNALSSGDAEAMAKARNSLKGLSYAASQMQFADWMAILDMPVEDEASLRAVRDQMEALSNQGAAQDEPEVASEIVSLFNALGPVLEEISKISMALRSGEAFDAETQKAIPEKVDALLGSYGLVRVMAAAEAIAQARVFATFKAAELSFYEELAAFETSVAPDGLPEGTLMPGAMLRTWCADNVFETLQALRMGLDSGRKEKGLHWFPNFEELMRRAYHAARNYYMDTAAQLTMSLIDLFSRVRHEGGAPDAILIQMARGFVDTMELVFDALDQGDTPDTAKIERLFEEAANVNFMSSGLVTSRSIEQRLNLPAGFRRVLSPESVKSAQDAIDAGLAFHIIRADLDDEQMAENFLALVTSSNVRMITNATVFQGDRTLFDFLVATSMSLDSLVEGIANIDPGGKNLTLHLSLEITDEDAAPVSEDEEPEDAGPQASSLTSDLKLLETIGEISAGQAMVRHMLNDLASADLLQQIEASLRQSGLPALDAPVRAVFNAILERQSTTLQQIAETGTQLSAQLTRLQEGSLAMRARPASVLLRPLAAFVSTRAKKLGHDAKLSHTGDAVQLDQIIIDELRGLLRRIIDHRLASDNPPYRFHLDVSQEEERVIAQLQDNGDMLPLADDLAHDASSLTRRGGELRVSPVPSGGVRHHIAIPLHVNVINGMVVRIGEVRYVLPIHAIYRIHQGEESVSISAAEGMRMLRLGEGDLLPIQTLNGHSNETSASGLYVILCAGEERIAVPVDEILGQQIVMLRPLRGVLAGIRGVSGLAILPGGETGMVISLSRMARQRNVALAG